MVTIGQTVSHYRILEKLGAGGMGEVYKAEDTKLGRTVALKVLPPERVADPDRKRRFVQEARAASALNHPNIITIYDIDEADGINFIAMEYVEGKTLDRLIARHGLRVNEALKYAVEMAAALTKAHSAGIVHRDLKPSNVMVTDDGLVKVLDFGLAKLMEVEATGEAETAVTAGPRTQEGTIVGTVGYMSPEQAEGKPVDARSDIFSFGAVLYEMLTGERAFQGETTASTLAAILRDEPRPLSQAVEGVPPEVERTVKRCLRKDRAHRFQTMADLKVTLGELREQLDSGELAGAASVAPPSRWPEAKAGETPALQRRALAVGGVFIVLAGLLIGLNVGGLRDRLLPKAAGTPRIESIAVLPLENLSRDPEQEYFADGMTDELITDLAQIGALRVISRTSVMHYKGTAKTLPEIARELNVDAVLEGSIQRAGSAVHVNAQLVQGATERHLWAKSYDRQLRDAVTLEEEIARTIAEEIQVRLSPTEQTRLASAHPVNPEAHELYLKGRYYWNKRTPETLKKSLEYFQQAVEKDPSYAPAYAGLADSYTILAAGGYRVLPSKEAYPKAEAAAMKALELDSTLAKPRAALALSKTLFDWDWQGAEREFKQAIELNPGYANAHHWYAFYFAVIGHHSEAIAEDRKAEGLDPLSLIISTDLGHQALGSAGLYDQEMEQCRKTLEMDPNFAQAHMCLAESYEHKGMYKEAIEETQKSIALSKGNLVNVACLGSMYARAGRRHDAIKILSELKARSKSESVPAGLFSYIYAALGEKDQAFARLEEAYDEREATMVELKCSAEFDPLRSDPRFQDRLRRMNFPP